MDYNIVIIGAGVVGLAIAAKLSEKFSNVLVIEQHNNFGNETSSRNSEVIHSGIYYPQNSLKAKLCVEGNRKLYEWCKKYDVPHNRIGKFIISVNTDEDEEIDKLYNRALLNGVSGIEKVSKEFILKSEPNKIGRASCRERV